MKLFPLYVSQGVASQVAPALRPCEAVVVFMDKDRRGFGVIFNCGRELAIQMLEAALAVERAAGEASCACTPDPKHAPS